MITAGIDVGAEAVKVVVLKDGKIVGTMVKRGGLDRRKSSQEALEAALEKAGLGVDDVQRTVATGIGRKDVAVAQGIVTEIAADVKGTSWLFPSAKTVIDGGAEESRGIRCDGTGKVLEFAKNDKCAAGVGSFVGSMARALEVTTEDMGPLALQSDKAIPMNVTCVVFAESEVVSLIHAKTPKPDIARAILTAIATRTTSMLRRVGIERDVAFIGGMARNPGLVELLKNHLGTELLVPEEPELVGALGAALIAATDGGQ